MSVNHPHPLPDFNILRKNLSGKYSHLHVIKETGEKSDWKNEVANWFAPINFYVYLWQPIRSRNYFFTRHPFFKTAFCLPHFNELWDNICKGSFAYNTFLFRKPAFSKNYNNTFLADLTCLALLFGDEFIDGICNETGKTMVQQLLKENGNRFYLSVKKNDAGYPVLEYGFYFLYQCITWSIWKITGHCAFAVKSFVLVRIGNTGQRSFCLLHLYFKTILVAIIGNKVSTPNATNILGNWQKRKCR